MLENTTRNTCLCTKRRTEHLWHKYIFTYWVLPKHVSQKLIYKYLHVAVDGVKTYIQKPAKTKLTHLLTRVTRKNWNKAGGFVRVYPWIKILKKINMKGRWEGNSTNTKCFPSYT